MNGGEPAYAWRRAELLDATARLGGRGRPGGRFLYCNSNYVVAAELAERAGGEDLEALLTDLVARPLGLRGLSFATAVAGTRLAAPHRALLCRSVGLPVLTGGRVPTDAIGPVWGDGGIAASAGELARFLEALLAGELTAPATVRAMVPRVRARGMAYGLGIMARHEGGAILAGHDGLYFGWTASASTDDATGTTVAAVCNVAGLRVPAARVAAAARAALRA
jgi:D-alanyl-D-alanine carboxypeptidase